MADTIEPAQPGDEPMEGIYTVATLQKLIRYAKRHGHYRVAFMDLVETPDGPPTGVVIIGQSRGDGDTWTTIVDYTPPKHECTKAPLQ